MKGHNSYLPIAYIPKEQWYRDKDMKGVLPLLTTASLLILKSASEKGVCSGGGMRTPPEVSLSSCGSLCWPVVVPWQKKA